MFSSPQTKSDATKKTVLCENTGKMTTWDVVDFNFQKFIYLTFQFSEIIQRLQNEVSGISDIKGNQSCNHNSGDMEKKPPIHGFNPD